MVNFTRLRLVKFIPISNTTLVIFIPNFTATHAITSTNNTENWQRPVATYAIKITTSHKRTVTEISVLLYAIINHWLIHRSTLLVSVIYSAPSCIHISIPDEGYT